MTTILVADDNPQLRQLLGTLVRREGYRAVEAATGDEALAGIREHHPAIALLDGVMPGLSGLEVCRAVWGDPSLAGTRLIIVSGTITDVEAREAGADLFLAKPFRASHIREAIATVLA